MKTREETPGTIIRTARSIDAINAGIKAGFKPLIVKLEPLEKLKVFYAVVREDATGKIHVINHPGYPGSGGGAYEILIDFSSHYPYHWDSPFAAYLLPAHLKVGDRVFLEDLIEDHIGGLEHRFFTRLGSASATWNGRGFDVENPFDADAVRIVG